MNIFNKLPNLNDMSVEDLLLYKINLNISRYKKNIWFCYIWISFAILFNIFNIVQILLTFPIINNIASLISILCFAWIIFSNLSKIKGYKKNINNDYETLKVIDYPAYLRYQRKQKLKKLNRWFH